MFVWCWCWRWLLETILFCNDFRLRHCWCRFATTAATCTIPRIHSTASLIVAMIRKTAPYNGDNVAKYNLWKRIYKFHLRVRAHTVLYYTVLAVKI